VGDLWLVKRLVRFLSLVRPPGEFFIAGAGQLPAWPSRLYSAKSHRCVQLSSFVPRAPKNTRVALAALFTQKFLQLGRS
jgi:hypothetical protein